MRMWEQFLKTLDEDFGAHTIDRWVRSLKIVRFDACNLYLEAEDSFQALWFEEHIRQKALKALKTNNGKPLKIHVQIKKSISLPKVASAPAADVLHFIPDALDKSYSYDQWILSEENRLTLQIFAELVHFNFSTYSFETPKPHLSQDNPIFLYGEEGSGKTHLLSATALALQKQKVKVLYVKAETFTEHMIKAIRSNQMVAFRQTYRLADVLIVDHIEHFANKAATQEEFFHTFNHYHMSGKQLILASRFPPSKLQGIEGRLISRFEWGLPVSLTSLTYKEMPLLLLKKLRTHHLSLPREISEYLLSMFKTPKILSQAVEILSYKHYLNPSKPFSLSLVKEITQSLADQALGKTLSPEKILKALAEIFDMNTEEILGKGQTKEIVFPRQLAMYLLRQKLHMPYPKIGKVFSKDHSTVMSSVKQIEEGVKKKEPTIVSRLEHFEKKIAV